MDARKLTPAQRDCLRLVAKGYSSKEIAKELSLSPRTVDTYLYHAQSELGAASRRDAARLFAAWERQSQKLQSQLQAIDSPELPADRRAPEALHSPFIPPLGGAENQLRRRAKITAIVRVSLLVALAVGLMISVYAWITYLLSS